MKKRPKRYWLTLIWVFPGFLISIIILFFPWLFWGNKLHWLEGFWFEWKKDSWPMNKNKFLGGWYAKWRGTTLVWAGILAPGIAGDLLKLDTKTERHEHIHVKQTEAIQLMSFIIAVSNFIHFWFIGFTEHGFIHGLIIWTIGAFLSYFCAGIQARLRGEEFYRGNHLEEAAYSQDD